MISKTSHSRINSAFIEQYYNANCEKERTQIKMITWESKKRLDFKLNA
jgi:hypothetical protein